MNVETKQRPLTSRTRVALAIARGLAAARGDRDLTAKHMVIGILWEGANPAMAALWYAGMSEPEMRRMRAHLENGLGDYPGRIPPRLVTIDVTPGEERVIALAEKVADDFGDDYLGTEHILLAALSGDDAVAREFLQHGISLAQYTEGLKAVRRGDPPPSEPRAI